MIWTAEWTRGDVFGLAQVLIAIFGFAVAIWQIARTASAAEATAKATAETADAVGRRLLSNDLLLMLPELHRLEDEVDSAVDSKSPEACSRALLSYQRRGRAIVAQLKTDSAYAEDPLILALEAAASAASSAKGQIQGGSQDALADVVKTFRAKVGKVDIAAADLTARLQRGTEK